MNSVGAIDLREYSMLLSGEQSANSCNEVKFKLSCGNAALWQLLSPDTCAVTSNQVVPG